MSKLPINKIICGDCREVMKQWPDNCIDTIITDPPYGLEFMGKEWDRLSGGFSNGQFKGFRLPKTSGGNRNVKCPDCGKWVYDHPPRNCRCGGVERYKKREIQQWHYRWAKECLRVAKPGAFLLCFGGTRTYHRLTCAIEDAGWQIRDCMMWLYGSGFPKSHNIGKAVDKKLGNKREIYLQSIAYPDSACWGIPNKSGQRAKDTSTCFGVGDAEAGGIRKHTKGTSEWEGYGTALKPAWEPIIVAIKPLDGTFAQNAEKWGVAGLNIDGGRIPTIPEDAKMSARPNSVGKIYKTNTYGDGRCNMMGIQKGRWPANLLLDEEAAKMLDEQVTGQLHQAGNKKPANMNTGLFGQGKAFSKEINYYDFNGGASRFFYVAKASRRERNEGLEGITPIEDNRLNRHETGQVWIDRQDGKGKVPVNRRYLPRQNYHPTVKPLKLMEYLCKLTKTPTSGIVLDPFVGSGTTCLACIRTGRNFIGIEKENDYCRIARRRIKIEVP